MSVQAMREAITAVAADRELAISVDDIEALALAASQADEWWDDEDLARHLPGRTSPDSRRSWCQRYGVKRYSLVSARAARAAIARMPGRGVGGGRPSWRRSS